MAPNPRIHPNETGARLANQIAHYCRLVRRRASAAWHVRAPEEDKLLRGAQQAGRLGVAFFLTLGTPITDLTA